MTHCVLNVKICRRRLLVSTRMTPRLMCSHELSSWLGPCIMSDKLSRRMGTPTIFIGENKGADQLRSNCEADQRLCFRYTDSTISLLSNSKISSLYPSSVSVQPGLCRIWSEAQIVGFLMHRLNYYSYISVYAKSLVSPLVAHCLYTNYLHGQ